ncbi:uncharacterized protein [Battus philenor]|uniref:uncharacterized protein n=1 Tax=Battus philenor TaxID=42288 RepID=UPI0035CF030E
MTFGRNSTHNWNSYFQGNGDCIFRTMTENRKRSREDDACEFMPLSKRINNLHINNNLTSPPNPQSPEHTHINGLNTEENGISNQPAIQNSDRRPSYDPGVSSSQSRYYYENKLLFELHLERIQRTGQQFPF